MKKIVDAVTGHRVSAVQFVPGFFVRVTFSTVQDRHDVFRYGVEIDGVKIPLTEAESTTRFVYVHHCPVEVSDAAVKDALSAYGEVLSVESCYYKGTSILTGSRIAKMSLEDVIPWKVCVYRYPCRVWYRDQPVSCRICASTDHRASDCPLRGKCCKCRQPGHFARDCAQSTEPVRVLSSSPEEMDVVSDVTAAPDPDRRSTKRFRSESSHASDDCSGQTAPVDVPVSSNASCQSIDVSPPSVPPSGVSPEDVPKSVSPNALVLREGDHLNVIDLGRLTRRCVVEDSATPEMYRECFYLDPTIKDVLPVMSVFPLGRDPLPALKFLSPDVSPAKFPAKSTVAEGSAPAAPSPAVPIVAAVDPGPVSSAPVTPTAEPPSAVPVAAPPVQRASPSCLMITAVPHDSSRPQWCTRLPVDFHRLLQKTNHSDGCQDHSFKVMNTVYDLGENTFRLLCGKFSFDKLRCRSPRVKKTESDFPGPAAIDLPCLAADVVPSVFPAPPQAPAEP